MKILFMCVANSARSQIAEGLAKAIFGTSAEIWSAGSQPTSVNPYAARALKEIGIDTSGHFSKSIDDLPAEFLKDLNYVITLCAEEVCPVLVSSAKKLHWPMPDPAGHSELSEEEQLELFRKVRDNLKKRIGSFKSELNP